ncbi:MAG: ribonuclease III [Candidatus Omnitrophica bacterium]|nr:ribonuclease III [Candidatus Omnitrophota bacterium]
MIRVLKKHVNWKKLERTLGLKIRNRRFAVAALTHPSYRNEMRLHNLLCFERMEFFGDSILNFTISEILYEKYREGDEGVLSKLKSILVSRKILSMLAKKLKLKRFMLLGKSEKTHPDPERAKIMADTFEAVIAAIYFDRGLAVTQRFLKKQFKYYLSPKRLHEIGVSPKTTLQELAQKHLKILPQYQSVWSDGGFLCTASLRNIGEGQGRGRTKKEAEEAAARELVGLFELKKVPT